MREGARRSRATRNRTYFLIQKLMNPSLAPLRAVRRALDVSVLVIAFQSRVTRLRPFRLACSASCASPSARVARALEKGIKRRADAIRCERVAKRERFLVHRTASDGVAVVSVPSLVLIQNRKPRRSH